MVAQKKFKKKNWTVSILNGQQRAICINEIEKNGGFRKN